MTGIVTARGDPYQYDDPEGVVNKENEAEGNQAESNHLVCCCGLQRERESEREPQAVAAARERLMVTCCLFSPRACECTAAGLKRGGERRPSAAETTPHQGSRERGQIPLREGSAAGPPARPPQFTPPQLRPSPPKHRTPPAPALSRKGPRRRPGPSLHAGGGQPGGSALAPGRHSAKPPHVNGPPEQERAAGRLLQRSPGAAGLGGAPDPTHHGDRQPRPPPPARPALPGAATNQRVSRQPHPPPAEGGQSAEAAWGRRHGGKRGCRSPGA